MAKETKTIGVKLIASWIFSVLFILAGVVYLFSAFISAVFYILAGLIILPPFDKFLKDKADIKITTWLKILIVLILLAFAGLSLPNNVLSDSNSNSVSTENQEQNIVEEEVIKITATDLWFEYDQNEIRADSKYKDKNLEISGIVDSIGEDILGTPYITLIGDGYFSNVQCMIKGSEIAKLVEINPGDSIVLKGDKPGYLLNVIVRNCEIIS